MSLSWTSFEERCLLAPEGRQVCRDVETPNPQPQRGSSEWIMSAIGIPQVETADVTPFNIRSLGNVSIIGEASLKS